MTLSKRKQVAYRALGRDGSSTPSARLLKEKSRFGELSSFCLCPVARKDFRATLLKEFFMKNALLLLILLIFGANCTTSKALETRDVKWLKEEVYQDPFDDHAGHRH